MPARIPWKSQGYKASIQCWASSVHLRNPIEMGFRWRAFSGDPIFPHKIKKKVVSRADKKKSGSAHVLVVL